MSALPNNQRTGEEIVKVNQQEAFQLHPIGTIRREGTRVRLEILEPYRPALQQLDHFSHVMVFWWAHKHDNARSRSTLQTEPPYAQGKVTGVFATRAEYRPNPIAMTTCKMVKVDQGNGIVEPPRRAAHAERWAASQSQRMVL
jgi:tRNA (Thr-GGU) A37 N-methylase